MRSTHARPAGEPAAGKTDAAAPTRRDGLLAFVLLGTFFGFVLVKTEVVSWFRIQEMFRFQSFHMYGVIGSAVAVAALSVWLIRRSGVRSLGGEEIVVPPKEWGSGTRYWLGGSIFGLGWALTGACPGPLAALVGAGIGVYLFAILSAVAGAWVYGLLRPRLPH